MTETPAPARTAPAELTLGAKIARVVGIVGQLGTLPWYASSGLLAPAWAIAVLLAVWAVLLVLAIRWWRTRPYLVLVVPVVAVSFWFAAISAGEAWLGWTG